MKTLIFTLITLSFLFSHAGRIDHYYRDIAKTGRHSFTKRLEYPTTARPHFPQSRHKLKQDLFRAAAVNDIVAIKRLFDLGVSPNIKDETGETPLHIAAKNNTFLATEMILRHPKVNPNLENSQGRTPLGVATYEARIGGYGIVEMILKHPKTNPNVKTYNPLHVAISIGDLGVMKVILEHPKTNPNIRSDSGFTPLTFAIISTGRLDMIEFLLKHPKTDPNLRDESTIPLITAINSARSDVVRAILKHPRTNPNLEHKQDQTPLFIAVYLGRLEIVEAILEHPRTNPNHIDSYGFTVLDYAKGKGLEDLLVKYGAKKAKML